MNKYNLYETNIPKNRMFFKVLITSIIFSTFGTAYRSNIYYMFWGSGIILGLLFVLDIVITQKIKKSIIFTFFYMIFWLVINVFLTNYVFDKSRHVNVLILTFFFTIVSILLVDLIMKHKRTAINVFYWVNFIWISLNLGLFILKLLNLYKFKGAFSGIFENRNNFAMNTTVLMSFLLYFYDKFPRGKLIKVKLMIGADVLLTLLTYSFKGLLGILIVFSIHSFGNKMKLNKKILYITLIGIIIFGIVESESKMLDRVNMYLNVFLTDRRETDFDTSSAGYRLSLIIKGLDIVKENKWTGIGIDNSRYFLRVINARGNEKYLYSHNNYIEMLLNGGIFVFIFYYLPIILVFFKLFKMRKQSKIIRYSIMLIILKLFLDIGAVTYNTFSNMFIHAFSIYVFFDYKYNKVQYDYYFN